MGHPGKTCTLCYFCIINMDFFSSGWILANSKQDNEFSAACGSFCSWTNHIRICWNSELLILSLILMTHLLFFDINGNTLGAKGHHVEFIQAGGFSLPSFTASNEWDYSSKQGRFCTHLFLLKMMWKHQGLGACVQIYTANSFAPFS